MKRTLVVIGILILSIIAFSYYYLYKNNPLLAYKHRSEENKKCEKKCQITARESEEKCGKDCFDGAGAIYAFDKVSKRCLMRSNLTGPDYYDFYIKDCDTNEYIKRWNVSKKELTASTTWPQIESQANMKREELVSLTNNLIGPEGEFFLLCTGSCDNSH